MELTTHAVTAGILRAAFVILGFMWGVIIVQNRENGGGAKGFGFALMAAFLAIGIWMTV